MKKGVTIGLIVLLVLVAGFLIYNYSGGGSDANSGLNSPSASASNSGGETKTFDVVAKQFEFNPGTIEVNEGDTVVLKIKSIDTTHGIAIPQFGVSETLNPGEEKTVTFVADKKGTYDFYCNVYCGSGHGSMKGTLVVK